LRFPANIGLELIFTEMDFVLDILKISVPAFIVFITVYYLMRTYVTGQLNMEKLKYQSEQQGASMPLRLKAYERLILLCERIALDDLMLRLRTRDMNAQQLKNVLMIAVKQEYDHNLSQQLYVSQKLWEILSAAKDQVLDLIFIAEAEAKSNDANVYGQKLLELFQNNNPVKTAKSAVVKEGQMYF
jgi:hypothetical protein